MATNNNFIGSGIIFPIEIGAKGRPEKYSNKELIESSIKMIVYWSKGTRSMNQMFGSRLEEILEEPNDTIAESLTRFFIKESLAEWENKINIKEVSILSNTTTKIDIKINYTINTNLEEETYIFPFYKNLIY